MLHKRIKVARALLYELETVVSGPTFISGAVFI